MKKIKKIKMPVNFLNGTQSSRNQRVSLGIRGHGHVQGKPFLTKAETVEVALCLNLNKPPIINLGMRALNLSFWEEFGENRHNYL